MGPRIAAFVSLRKGENMNRKNDAVQTSSEGVITPLYAPASFYLLRTPAFSAHTLAAFLDSSLTLGKDKDVLQHTIVETFERASQQGYSIVRDLLAQSPLLNIALSVASRDLQEGIARLPKGENVKQDARTKRVYSRILRYIVRMCSRPTPFGLFAGVGLGHWHTHTDLTLENPTVHHRLRPDMGWLLAFIQRLEQDEKLLPHLQLMRNATAYVAGSRLIIPPVRASSTIHRFKDPDAHFVHAIGQGCDPGGSWCDRRSDRTGLIPALAGPRASEHASPSIYQPGTDRVRPQPAPLDPCNAGSPPSVGGAPANHLRGQSAGT